MSEDQEPARSRRALRRAREAQAERPDTGGSAAKPLDPSAPADPGTPERPRPAARRAVPARSEPRRSDAARSAGTGSSAPQSGSSVPGGQPPKTEPAPRSRRRRAADAPVDSAVDSPQDSPRERSSQARARDRETLRTYKALSDQDAKRAERAPLTRRQLRQQQLEAERRAAGSDAAPAADASAPAPSAADGAATPTEPAQQDKRDHSGERGQQRRSRAAVRTAEASARSAEKAVKVPPAAAEPLKDDELNEMSVEQALAARAALVEQAKNQLAMLDASKQEDPLAVDLEVLAEQKKLAERAAVLNQRAMAKQRLSEESQRSKQPRYDPASTHNLAMVTPLEFVRVPGIDQPVMQAPATSHIPVITSATQRVPAVTVRPKSAKPRQAAAAQHPDTAPVTDYDASLPPSVLSGDDPRNASGSRSHVLAHAEAVASTRVAAPPISSRSLPRPERPEPTDEGGPISAHTAHGLEPLDSMTAGLARSKRSQLLQLLILLFGSIALVVGLMMIFGV